MIDLIILDMYGTIVSAENCVRSRNGFDSFMNTYQDKTMVLVTDSRSRDRVDYNLSILGIRDKIKKVYTYTDLIEIEGYSLKRKDLKKVCSDFNVLPSNSIFISDSDKDHEDAMRDGINFIHVPYYYGNKEVFSFSLIDLSKPLQVYSDLRAINLKKV